MPDPAFYRQCLRESYEELALAEKKKAGRKKRKNSAFPAGLLLNPGSGCARQSFYFQVIGEAVCTPFPAISGLLITAERRM